MSTREHSRAGECPLTNLSCRYLLRVDGMGCSSGGLSVSARPSLLASPYKDKYILTKTSYLHSLFFTLCDLGRKEPLNGCVASIVIYNIMVEVFVLLINPVTFQLVCLVWYEVWFGLVGRHPKGCDWPSSVSRQILILCFLS